MNPCGKCGAPATEQIRGDMGPGDYVGQHRDYYRDVSADNGYHPGLHDGNRRDFRIACTQCDNAQGWNQPDAPGYPGAVKAAMLAQWDKDNHVHAK
jgi:hypothetical protein